MRAFGRKFADLLLSIAAAGGAVCIILVPLAWLFDISIIMFRTGSMVPTLEPGDIAIVQEIPAEDIEAGDVVTVDREGALPVTHRVTSVEEGPSSQERVITMQGDANETEDPHPYTVETVRTVLFSIPGIATGVAFFSDSRVLAVATLVMSLVVGWAFWPRGPVVEEDDEDDDAAGESAEEGSAPQEPEDPEAEDDYLPRHATGAPTAS
ncbi:signal peptidase I [Nesterenkonia alba]|uniref:signal peptidase I n=1 Tax=Nesterenkonia alba TaxID=515814 RepID=UPI0003B3EC6F|nr:signal peptidase I [Nesterenkonia alba]